MKAKYHIAQSRVQLSVDRPVRVERLVVVNDVRPHDHEFHELSFFTSGQATHVTALGRTRLEVGHAVVIPPGGVHAFRAVRDAKVINVYFLPEWLDPDLNLLWDEPGAVPLFCSESLVQLGNPEARELLLTKDELTIVDRELAELSTELAGQRPSQPFMKSCFLKMAIVLSRVWCRSDPRWRDKLVAPVVRQTLADIERAIDTGDPFIVASAARSSGLSTDRLTVVFRKALGYSPMEFYQRRRVQRACQLLANPRLSITDIAMTLGYADTSHFSRTFKKQRRISPRAYRDTYGTKQNSLGIREQ